jgi:hypothetical protein
MTNTIQNLFPIISLAVSLYILYLYFIQKQNNNLIEDNQELIKKQFVQKDTEIKALNHKLKSQEDMYRSMKYKLENNTSKLEKKVSDLFDRWSIVADDRITSIPQTNKEWWDAKEIIEQKEQKKWKGKNLSQTKDSFVNENTKYNNQVEENEEEVNQDFSEFSDEDFENIIDEDEEDSSSSSATDNTQNRKPKPKKDKSKQMKM